MGSKSGTLHEFFGLTFQNGWCQVKYLSKWTGILFKRDRWEMSIETGYKIQLTL
jgi:hypothetical protein